MLTTCCIRGFHMFKHLPCTSTCGIPLFSQLLTLRNPTKCVSRLSSQMRSTSFTFPPYLSVHIHCPKDVSDSFSEALLCFGASSTALDQEKNCQNEQKVTITSIFFNYEDVDECILRAAKSIGLEKTPMYKITEGDQSNWIKLSQESFQPVEVTEGLWTVPAWITSPDLKATNVILNPGFAFGTGDHPTTKLCLLLLHSIIKGGEHVLDYGTGSGVLAITAIKFGAALSVGLDINPEAIKSARHNATLNNIEDEKLQLHLVDSNKTSSMADVQVEVKTVCGTSDFLVTGKYDVVIANILLNPLLDLADDIVSYAKPGAVVGLSGILSEQVPCIMERYTQLLESILVSKMDGWACITGTKRKGISC